MLDLFSARQRATPKGRLYARHITVEQLVREHVRETVERDTSPLKYVMDRIYSLTN